MQSFTRIAVRQIALNSRSLRATTSPKNRAYALRTMATANNYHILQYQYVPDILEKRTPYRAAHLEGATNMANQNKLVMAGALTDPVDGAIFIFRNVTKEDIEAFVKADPYMVNGLVPSYSIRPYMVVAGDRD